MLKSNKSIVKDLLAYAHITINGSKAHDIQVHDDRFYDLIIQKGTLGMGEAYMAKFWDCEDIPQMMANFSTAKLSRKVKGNIHFAINRYRSILFNEGTKDKALFGVQSHYDIGNDLYQAMLDERMVYTCAYWNDANTLANAQEDKLELICRKLMLEPGMTILDIGGGWGSFAKYAAQKYKAKVTVVTNSKEQIKLGSEMCKDLDVTFEFKDYRDVQGQFDRVLSVGMFEHVCYKNHQSYMDTVNRCLKENGISLLHTMGRKEALTRGNDQWITKYIFPNTQVPSVGQIGQAIDGLFVMEDWENLSTDYEKTLLAWHENFVTNWNQIKNNYDETFYRMWTYYLLICAGWYRSRVLQLWQVVLTKNGIPGGYNWQKQRKLEK